MTRAATAQHLSAVTSELQQGLLKTRMQPIGTIFGRFHRVVRDLAQSCGTAPSAPAPMRELYTGRVRLSGSEATF